MVFGTGLGGKERKKYLETQRLIVCGFCKYNRGENAKRRGQATSTRTFAGKLSGGRSSKKWRNRTMRTINIHSEKEVAADVLVKAETWGKPGYETVDIYDDGPKDFLHHVQGQRRTPVRNGRYLARG